MLKDEHTKLLDTLKNATNEVDRMNIIVQLENDYTEVLTTNEQMIKDFETVNAEKIKYAELNNKLWLQANASIKEVEQGGQPNDDAPPKKRSFDDLNFD